MPQVLYVVSRKTVYGGCLAIFYGTVEIPTFAFHLLKNRSTAPLYRDDMSTNARVHWLLTSEWVGFRRYMARDSTFYGVRNNARYAHHYIQENNVTIHSTSHGSDQLSINEKRAKKCEPVKHSIIEPSAACGAPLAPCAPTIYLAINVDRREERSVRLVLCFPVRFLARVHTTTTAAVQYYY